MKQRETKIVTSKEGEEESVLIEIRASVNGNNNNSIKETKASNKSIKERVSSKSLLVKVSISKFNVTFQSPLLAPGQMFLFSVR